MKSKIPHPKTIRSDEKRVPISSLSVIPDPILIQDALILLGAPHIEREEFSRIYHGPLAEALVFVSEHMKGRKEVALARHRIHQLREARLKSHLKQPDDITRPATDKAASILSGAKKNVEILKKQLDDRQVALDETQDTLERLKRKLDEKQRTTLLLSVLELKEKIRVKRFQEMTKMITELRKGVSETKSHPNSTESSSTRTPPTARTRPPRVSHTQNALTNLHAHHLRLTRLMEPRDTSESKLLGRLRTGIARQTGNSETDPNTRKFLDQFISFVRARANRRRQFQPQSLPPVSELELERRHNANRAKERELQNLSDRTVALGFLCEHSISSVNIFVEKTSPVLRSSLNEEAPLAKGYIDVLRCIVVDARPGENPDKARFVQQVRRACNMGGRTVPSEIIAWLEATIRKAHRQALFLEASAIPKSLPLTAEQEALIVSYETSAKTVQDRTVKLLTRKVEKAEMGYSLVKDIQNLLQETKVIVG